PMAGTITYLNVEVGEIAQAQTAFTQGQTLLTISDLSVFEVEVDVDETEIAKVAAGQKVDIRVDAFRDTIFPGTIVEISNSAKVSGQGTDNFSTTFRVKVRFNEANVPVRPGMSATVDITTQVDHDALLIPYAAVLTREFDPDSVTKDNSDENTDAEKSTPYSKKKSKIKKTGVFVIKDGAAMFVELTTGIADERNLVALTGLTPGDTVISGSFQTLRKLKEGDLVKIEEASLEKMKENES
ncbi:MAG: HlyD family efflux transporter periplasmic adaptor subunit, partial [candidate division Zixibacteria bacterium]|nr:HlyD family efflux transporter periplasmic adaptor subunit [candidate division Zixibacteria bacterium]